MSPRTISIRGRDGSLGCISASRRALRRQPLNQPAAFALARVAEAVVQTIGAPLPKLDRLWRCVITAPVWRQRNHAACETHSHFRQARFQQFPAAITALFRGPRAELAAMVANGTNFDFRDVFSTPPLIRFWR